MKIIKDNKIYVQVKDVIYLVHTNIHLPEGLFEILDISSNHYIMTNELLNFVEYTGIEYINLFNSVDYLIDYDKVSSLNEEQLIRLGTYLTDKRNLIVSFYNSLTYKEKLVNKHLILETDNLDHQIKDLFFFIKYKNGIINIPFPIICSKKKIRLKEDEQNH